MTPRTKTARIAREGLLRNLIRMERDRWIDSSLRELVPDAWHTLEHDLDVEEPKEKVTLYLDRSVARFYRAMGKGYHARINRLLATWAQMRIAEEVRLDAHLAKQAEEVHAARLAEREAEREAERGAGRAASGAAEARPDGGSGGAAEGNNAKG